jgi:hypothetical protein
MANTIGLSSTRRTLTSLCIISYQLSADFLRAT